MGITAGTWKAPGFLGTLGVKIPDFGLTEKYAPILGRNPNQPNQSMNFPVTTNNGQIQGVSVNQTPTYTPPKTTTIRPNTTNQSNQNTTLTNDAINTVNSNTNQYNDFINQDYNNAIGYLDQQEQGIRGDAGIAENEISTGYTSAIGSLGNAQSEGQAGVANQVQTGEKSASNAMQQARDVFRQTQQNNIMQLSGAGLSSSSVNEALSERLGIETARRIFSVTGNLDEIRQNASKELSRINQYYSNKKIELESTKNIEVSKIKSALNQGLNQINNSRNQATSDKAKSRFDLLSNAQSQIASIKQQQLQFENSLKEWATKNSSALQPLATDPSFLKSISDTQNNFNSTFNPTGFNYAPSFSTNANGQVNSAVKWSPTKKDLNDPNASLDNALSELNQ